MNPLIKHLVLASISAMTFRPKPGLCANFDTHTPGPLIGIVYETKMGGSILIAGFQVPSQN